MHIAVRALLVGATLAAIPARAQPDAAPDAAEAERPLSRAQVELFRTPHLGNVRQPEALRYDFTRTGPAGFTDSVTVHVREARADGTRDVSFDFLTGERRENHPPVQGFSGNPLLMIFLEHDVRTLKESIGVSATYWRNRIRDALLERATVEDVTATVDGRPVPARKVSVRPFEREDRLRRVPPVRDKLYTFVLAEAVPGGIVEIRTDMAADAGLGVPAAGERLVFRAATPDAPGLATMGPAAVEPAAPGAAR